MLDGGWSFYRWDPEKVSREDAKTRRRARIRVLCIPVAQIRAVMFAGCCAKPERRHNPFRGRERDVARTRGSAAARTTPGFMAQPR